MSLESAEKYHQAKSAQAHYRMGSLQYSCKQASADIRNLLEEKWEIPRVVQVALSKIADDLANAESNALSGATQAYPVEVAS